ncbi:MAG: hypothetical protein ABIN89_31365 [Chitinophagaceae bacterium]
MANKSYLHFARMVFQNDSVKKLEKLKHLKYYWQWRKTFQPGRNAIEDELPWITFPGIDFLKDHLNKDSNVFEYGGGGSSLFFINHANEVVTIEHHKEWFEKVRNKVLLKKSSNWIGKLIPPDLKEGDAELDPNDPHDYYTNEEPYYNCIFKSYVTYIDNYPEKYFDLVMIDGRSRPSCIWHSMPKVKPGGYILIDNSNRRSYFAEVMEKLEFDFELIFDEKGPSPYMDYLTQTAVWQRKTDR